jgi:rRNA maturation RNase YbeY
VHPENFEVGNYCDTLQAIIKWICEELKLIVASIDLIFVGDNELKKMHKEYINDDSYTDVMAFNLSNNQTIEGEIYISYNRAKVQAEHYKVSILNEISRLLIHACLHFAGYDDTHSEERTLMRRKEDTYLRMANDLFFK